MVQNFYTALYTTQNALQKYQKECAKWNEAYGEKATPQPETLHEKRQRYIKKRLTGRMPANLIKTEIKEAR